MTVRDENAETVAREDSPHAVRRPTEPEPSRGPPVSREPGAVLAGRYRLEGLIGRGGMGEVHRAFDQLLGERVALKLLPPAAVRRDASAESRIRDEVSLARKVSHPNVCRVHDVGEAGGELFVTMELIEGEDLASLLRRIGRFPGEKALETARQITAGLAAAHAAGVLHRDLKPANIMFDARGDARISDFGLAVSGAVGTGDAAEVAGTPAYMAPEILAGGSASVRSDLYGLGLLLYELFAGRRPVEATTLAELRERRLTTRPVPLSQLVAGVDPRVDRVLLSCLAVDPVDRPLSALHVLTELTGGDAVGAALAAGQTPSPSAVAASGPAGALRPAVAWGLVTVFAGSVALMLFAHRLAPGLKLTVPELDGVPLPPAVLAAKGHDALASLGIPEPPGREEGRFYYSRPALSWAEAGLPRTDRFQRLFETGRPAPIRFELRKGLPPERVLSPRAASVRPLVVEPLPPGAVCLDLDTRGRLLRLVAGPDPAQLAPHLSAGALRDAALRLAGLDPSWLTPAEASFVPPVFADERSAWNGKVPGRSPQEFRVELATYRARPVYFSVGFEPAVPAATRARAALGMDQLLILLELGLILAAFVLASRNLRAGSGDRAGALRLFIAVFLLDFLVQFLRGAVPASAGAFSLLFFWRAGASLAGALTVTVFYLAIEPHARRLWPECLVSWARILSGRRTDPLVGRDILLGLVIYQGLSTAMFLVMGLSYLSGTGAGARPRAVLAPLAGTRYFLAALADAPRNGIEVALFLLVVLVLVRLAVPARLVLPVFFGLSFAFMLASLALVSGSPRLAHLLLATFFAGTLAVVITRLGLISTMVGVSLFDLAVGVPVTLNLDLWWSDRTLWILGLLGAIAVWSARISTRRGTA